MGLAAFNRMRRIEEMKPENIQEQTNNQEVVAENPADATISTLSLDIQAPSADIDSSTENTTEKTTTRRRRKSETE